MLFFIDVNINGKVSEAMLVTLMGWLIKCDIIKEK